MDEPWMAMSHAQFTAMRNELLRIAQHHEDLANAEASKVPYWSPYPASVLAHRAAAHALRADATLFEASR
jgi:hypothetical protein